MLIVATFLKVIKRLRFKNKKKKKKKKKQETKKRKKNNARK